MTLLADIAAAGITIAHIVDDVYDKVPGAGLPDAALGLFFDNLDEPQFQLVATTLGLPEGNEDELKGQLRTQEGAAALYPHRAQFGEHGERLFENFSFVVGAERNALQPLTDMLEALGVTCHTFGREYELNGQPEPQLLFVDLKLNEDTIQIEQPILAVRKMQQNYQGAHPLVFLMSTLNGPLAAQRDRFRSDLGLFSSQFEEFPKDNLRRPPSFQRFLDHHVRVYRRIVALQQHVVAWKGALDAANTRLQRTLLQLDFADYFTLHNTAAADGMKLGGYVTDMLLEYVAYQIEGSPDVGGFSKELDSWDLKDVTRSRFDVSPPVAEIFETNVWHSPGRLRWEHERGLSPAHGVLSLGDVFFMRSELAGAPVSAVVVLQPACDLVRPADIVDRKATILLCKGTVEPFKKSLTLSGEGIDPVILEYPPDSGTRHVITWRLKRPTTWEYTELAKMKEPNEEPYQWVRVGRLRPLYALQLQRAVTSDLARVGTQRVPVTRIPMGIDVLSPSGGKWHTLHSVPLDPSASAISNDRRERKRTFVLADPVIRVTFEKLEDWIEGHPNDPASPRLRELAQCPEAIRALMYYSASSTTDKDDGIAGTICPVRETDLPAGQPASLRTAVAFVAPHFKRPADARFGNGKDIEPEEPVLLAFRFLQIK